MSKFPLHLVPLSYKRIYLFDPGLHASPFSDRLAASVIAEEEGCLLAMAAAPSSAGYFSELRVDVDDYDVVSAWRAALALQRYTYVTVKIIERCYHGCRRPQRPGDHQAALELVQQLGRHAYDAIMDQPVPIRLGQAVQQLVIEGDWPIEALRLLVSHQPDERRLRSLLQAAECVPLVAELEGCAGFTATEESLATLRQVLADNLKLLAEEDIDSRLMLAATVYEVQIMLLGIGLHRAGRGQGQINQIILQRQPVLLRECAKWAVRPEALITPTRLATVERQIAGLASRYHRAFLARQIG